MTALSAIFLPLALWALMWGMGGWLLTRSAFTLARVEQMPVALLVGIVLNILFGNMLGRILPIPLAFWLASAGVLLLGIAFSIGTRPVDLLRIPILPGQWLVLAGMAVVLTLAERGLPIFDDYAHLPTLSLMAAGEIPPRFPLNPGVVYNYHYFLLLFAAQLTRIGNMEIWKSIDVARSVAFAVTFVLACVWTQRLARSRAAGVLGGLMLALGSGTRWLLLLLPVPVVIWLSSAISMLGSASQTAPDLANALSRMWGVEGMGAVGFPFAFANGIFAPGVLSASGPNSVIGTGIALFFLLSFNRWRSCRAMAVSTLIMASMALLTEFDLVLSMIAWGAVTVLFVIQHKTWRLPANLWQWLLVFGLGNLLGMFQGGALADIFLRWIDTLQGQSSASYQTVSFAFSFTPEIVSSHLGVLSLANLRQLIVAGFEIGPILLVLPLLALWGIKAYRSRRWYELVLVLTGFLSLFSVFIHFTGSAGVRNTSRLYSFVGLCALYAVPLVWMWVRHRSERFQWIAASLAAVVMFGGAVILSVILVAGQRPIFADFLTDLDAKMYDTYWNRLDRSAIVFDSDPYRATTIFGRPTLGYTTWFESTADVKKFIDSPDPSVLRAAGYTHVYLDNFYFRELTPDIQAKLTAPCVQQIAAFSDWANNTRTLLDIRGCR
jgi:hypothetical protein